MSDQTGKWTAISQWISAWTYFATWRTESRFHCALSDKRRKRKKWKWWEGRNK